MTIDARDVRVSTLRTTFDLAGEHVAMCPVRGSDSHFRDIKVAELVRLRLFDSVLRDVLLVRMIFEGIQGPHGCEREATREDLATTDPNTTGRDPRSISIPGVNADFLRMQTHFQHDLRENFSCFVAYEDLLRFVSPSPKIDSQSNQRLVFILRQLRHHIDDRARRDDGRSMIDGTVHARRYKGDLLEPNGHSFDFGMAKSRF